MYIPPHQRQFWMSRLITRLPIEESQVSFSSGVGPLGLDQQTIYALKLLELLPIFECMQSKQLTPVSRGALSALQASTGLEGAGDQHIRLAFAKDVGGLQWGGSFALPFPRYCRFGCIPHPTEHTSYPIAVHTMATRIKIGSFCSPNITMSCRAFISEFCKGFPAVLRFECANCFYSSILV